MVRARFGPQINLGVQSQSHAEQDQEVRNSPIMVIRGMPQCKAGGKPAAGPAALSAF